MTDKITKVKIDSIYNPEDKPFFHRPLRQTGNSTGIYLPHDMLEALNWKAGHIVRIVLDHDRIVLEEWDKPHRDTPLRFSGEKSPIPTPAPPPELETVKPKVSLFARKTNA